jgi:microsomal dipeptidase-like Zn-dependent dipeptidase
MADLDLSPAGRRLLWASAAAVALVAGGLLVPGHGSDAGRTGSFGTQYNAAQAAAGQPQATTGMPSWSDPLGVLPHLDPPGTPPHTHNDPTTKNDVSRSTEQGKQTQDPTTPQQRQGSESYVASQRALPDPTLTTAPATWVPPTVPTDIYAMANGCYGLAGEPVYFKPTALGSYLLYDRDGRFLTANGGRVANPSTLTDFAASRFDGGFRFDAGVRPLNLDGTTVFHLSRTTGCRPYPEIEVDVSGDPHAGVSSLQEVRGYVDAHTHGMAFEFLGGDAHCGRPWHKYGAPYALVDCPDHTLTGGFGGALEDVMSGEPHHDPVGWPTFEDWPAPESLTHEGTYWKWIERSWRGGQRILVNLFVENNKLCQLYPLKRNSCDDMDSIRLQAEDIYALQDYIDAQSGGPGKGFYRIVTNPWDARRVINQGKLAVVLGIETSVPFGCTMKLDRPACSLEQIDTQLDEVRGLGVSQMELVNKFDNALAGVAGDQGAIGPLVNAANFLETGSFWDMRHCEPADGESHDQNQTSTPGIDPETQDALFGAIAKLALPRLALPVYAPPDHCNSRGLTTLGAHTIEALAARHMLFDPDHMSVKARRSSLDVIDRIGYSGVLSTHSWSTPDAYPRIYAEGGFIAAYAGDSSTTTKAAGHQGGFVDKWRRHVGWADPRYYWGFGFGADINGLGAQGDPRGAGVPNPVTYPFTGLGGVTIGRQHSGRRVYDVNVDGVAHYGLYPDWIEDLRQVAGSDGDAIVADLARGAEAYLQTWERAYGVRPDPCRNPSLRRPVATAVALAAKGLTSRQVLDRLGQPYTRLGRDYGYCAVGRGGRDVTLNVTFDGAGRVAAVSRG